MTATIIVGPPCAGKSTYAWGERGDADVVVDYDRLASALGSGSAHAAAGDIASAAFAARGAVIARAIDSDWPAWIIHTSPTEKQIAFYEEAGARFVLLDPGEDECLARALDDDRPDGTDDVIKAWYADQPQLPADAVTVTDYHPRTTIASGREGDTRMKNPFGIPQAKAPQWFSMARDEADPTVGDIFVYDVIDSWYGVSAQSFADALVALGDVTQINLFVNSPGGSVYDAIAMRAALVRHPANITAYVDGYAASAASFLITGADEIVMSANSELMIHDASNYAYGNAEAMRENGVYLDRVSNNIADMYAARAGSTREDMRALMLAETWFSDQEAVDAGLADRVAPAPKKVGTDDTTDAFDLSVFAHAGRKAAPVPFMPGAVATARRRLVDELHLSPADAAAKITATMLEQRDTKRPAEPGTTTPSTTNTKGVDPMADLKKQFRDRLGIPADRELSDDQLVAALDEVLNEGATTVPPAALPGTTVIDEATLQSLRDDATAGRSAFAAQVADRRDRTVDDAIADGRIPVARRDHYRALLEADEEGTTALLGNLAAGLIVNTQASGFTGGIDESSSDDNTLFAKYIGAPGAADTTKED